MTRPKLEGILTGIKEIGAVFARRDNGIIGPGCESWEEKTGDYTLILIETAGKEKNIYYSGIILPDSIGHRVQVFEDERIKILDLDLNRWYK